jgi:nicotinamidase-related amidase
VQLTAMDAFLREYRIRVPSDCTSAESGPAKDAALEYMASILKCDITASVSSPKRTRRTRRRPAL